MAAREEDDVIVIDDVSQGRKIVMKKKDFPKKTSFLRRLLAK